jgi:hypothetical protein
MSLGAGALMGAVADHALTTGLFESVNGHEPKAKPGAGLTAALWVALMGPVPRGSGLVSTTARVELTMRIYTSMLAEPQDAIDPTLLDAADRMMTEYAGDFGLGGLVRQVDLLGEYGAPLACRAGYLSQDGKLFRVMDLTIPLIVNDLWQQVE